MAEFITDRSKQHLELLYRLRKKGWPNMSASEREMWYGEAAKGAYNHTDLNRVESAVAEISELWGLGLTTKTDWTIWDIPTKADMERYLGNVRKILESATSIDAELAVHLWNIPYTMNYLTLEGANNIEIALEAVYGLFDSRLGSFVLGTTCLSGGV